MKCASEGLTNSYIFEVGAIERPTVEAAQGGATARMVLEPTYVVAADRGTSIAKASRGITGEWAADRTTFIVRKFVGDLA